MTQETQEINPCPWCESECEIREEGEHPRWVYIRCIDKSCCYSGPHEFTSEKAIIQHNRIRLVPIWVVVSHDEAMRVLEEGSLGNVETRYSEDGNWCPARVDKNGSKTRVVTLVGIKIAVITTRQWRVKQ